MGGHGIYPVEGMKYKAIVVPSETPLVYKPKSLDEVVAIPLGDELVLTPQGKSEKAMILTIGNSRAGRGTVYKVFKFGEKEKTFKSTKVVDEEKLNQGLQLRQEALEQLTDNNKFVDGLRTEEEANILIRESRLHITKNFEVISPSILLGRGIEIGPGNVSIIARGIVNNLLLVEVNGPLKVQVFTHEETK